MEVLVEELLSPEIQQGLSKPVFTIDEIRSYLLGKFGNLSRTIEVWVQKLEQAAAARLKGTRHRYDALVSALKLIKRVQALSPEVPEWEILVVLSRPRLLSRIQETLQPQDVEGCRQEIYKKQLRPSREGVAESLRTLRAYLVNMIQGLKDAGPPAPLYQEDEDDDEECVDPEYEY